MTQKGDCASTDSRALDRCREYLARAAAQHGLKPTQNSSCEAPRPEARIGPLYAYEAVQAGEEGATHFALAMGAWCVT